MKTILILVSLALTGCSSFVQYHRDQLTGQAAADQAKPLAAQALAIAHDIQAHSNER